MTTIIESTEIPSAASMAPENTNDVIRAVNEARSQDLRMAIVATGHGMKPLGNLAESFVIRTSGLDSVEIDPDRRIARIGGGVTWNRLLEEAGRHGLVAPFGTAGSVGVTGYSLGGGVGPLGRFLGLGSSAVRAIELVTVEGEERRVDAISDPELFWGLKGGGGGFGVVTAIELDLTPLPDMTGGLLIFPFERAEEVARTWARWTRSVPTNLTSSLRFVQVEPGQAMAMIMIASPAPEIEVTGQIEDLVALGPVVNTVGATNPSTFIAENGDPDDGPPFAIEHTLIDSLPEDAIESAIEFADPAKGSPLVMTEFRHLGGALAEPAARGGALDRLDGEYMYMVMSLPDGHRHVKHAADVLSDYGRGRSYLNFGVEPIERKSAFDPKAVTRLAALYERLDPEKRMHQPHPM